MQQHPAEELTDLELIRSSSYFDEAYYRAHNSVPSNVDAARHYLDAGAHPDLMPSRYFSNKLYLELNPDVAAVQFCPLLHWERYGKTEHRKPGLPAIWGGNYIKPGVKAIVERRLAQLQAKQQIEQNADARVLVICHLFYFSALPEIRSYLDNLEPYHPHFVFSYIEGWHDQEMLDELRAYGDVEFVACENRGYDLAPFFEVLAHTNLDDYDVVFKLHSKSTDRVRPVYGTYFTEREWFCRLFDGIVGPKTVHTTMELLYGSGSVGLVAEEKVLSLQDPPYIRRMVAEQLAQRGLPAPVDNYRFVGGTCFAVRAAALKPIQALGITGADFENVRYGKFSLAHALEREICSLIEAQGYELYGIATHDDWTKTSAARAKEVYAVNGHRIREALDLCFSDDDLLTLNSCFFESWGIEKHRVGELLVRDKNENLCTLADTTPNFFTKHADKWHATETLSSFVHKHWMRAHDTELAQQDGVAYSQAIVVNQDLYIMCGHDAAYTFATEKGCKHKLEVIRVVYKKTP